MTRLKAHAAFFLSGIVAAVAFLVLLMVFGVLPVKTEHTTVVEQQVTGTTMATTALTSGTLTPAQIYQKYAQGVVEIIATFSSAGQSAYGPFGGTQTQKALGSGFVVSKDGYILTNAHVVSDAGQRATKLTVSFKSAGSQTTSVSGRIVGVDTQSDVAVVKVDPSGLKLNPLPMGDSNAVQVGEPVVAIGNPLRLEFTLTSGIVSAIHRDYSPQAGTNIFNGIQTDAAINPGNSGGPLIDASGNVIGINESIASITGGSEGLGFAVPIDTANNSYKQIRSNGKVTYAWMGVTLENLTPDLAKVLKYPVSQGALVGAVAAGSPAAKAGIKGGTSTVTVQGQQFTVGGDVITALDGKPVSSSADLAQAITAHKPGDVVTVTINRHGATSTLKVTLGTRPANL